MQQPPQPVGGIFGSCNGAPQHLSSCDFNSIEALLDLHHSRVQDLLEAKLSWLLQEVKTNRVSSVFSQVEQVSLDSPNEAASDKQAAEKPMATGSDMPVDSSDASQTPKQQLTKSKGSLWNLTEKEADQVEGTSDLVLQEDDIREELDQAVRAVLNHKKSQEYEPKTLMQRIVHNPYFELTMGSVILFNLVVVLFDLEYVGVKHAVLLGIRADVGAWNEVGDACVLIEHFLNAVFCLEFIMRVLADGPCVIFRSYAVAFDGFFIITLVLDYVGSSFNLSFLRSVRLVKLVRIIRSFQAAAAFSELRTLMSTCVNSMMALTWSCVLLLSIMLLGGMLMAQTCSGILDDDAYSMELRLWTYKHYGSGMRAIYTVFEATMSGGWPNYARRLIEEVSVLYGIWWLFYVVIVIFAVTRVVTALFLQKTMEMAQADEDLMMLEKLKIKQEMLTNFRHFLHESDLNEDGQMNRTELQELLKNVTVKYWLEEIGLETHELVGLFNVLDEGSGVVSHEDVLGGLMRIQHGVRAVDSVVMMHELHKIRKKVAEVLKYVMAGEPDTTSPTCTGNLLHVPVRGRRSAMNV